MDLKETTKTPMGKKQSKYRCPCCNKLWGSKVKLNCHWLYTPCDGARAIENHKLWSVVATIVKEISQSSVQGASSAIVIGNALVAQSS